MHRRKELPPTREQYRRDFPKHRAFIKAQPCCVRGCYNLPVDPAHLRSVTKDGAGLTPADFYCVPLCRMHHTQAHEMQHDKFADLYRLDLWGLSRELVARSPDQKMKEHMEEYPE